MKTKTIAKYVILTAIFTVLICFGSVSFAAVVSSSVETASNDAGPKYKPGEILVKFKDGANPQSVLQEIGLQPKSVERTYPIKPVVATFKKDYKLEKDPSTGWYSFLGKHYKEIAEIPDEDVFKKAYTDMPEAEKAIYRNYKIELPEGVGVEEAIAKLKDNPDVEYAEPNGIVTIQMVPNDPYYSSANSWGQGYDDMWGLKKIQCAEAWNISQGEGVVVAVIDTGADYNHPDLAQNIWINEDEIPSNGIDDDGNGYIDDIKGWDFGYGDNDPMDGHGHGTHIAGTIAAIGNNGLGVIGVAPKSKIMAVKGFWDTGSSADDVLAKCIKYAADNGAKVLSNSWGRVGTSATLEDAFHYADSKGCVPIAAAGNDTRDTSEYTPANIDTVIAVAASNQNDALCQFSNYGDTVAVAAPGGDSWTIPYDGTSWYRNILSLRSDNNGHPTDMYYGDGASIVNNQYYRAAGTSMACPHVAGIAALMLSENPSFSADEVRCRMRFSSDIAGGVLYPGNFGRVNAFKALTNRVSIEITSPAAGGYARGNLDVKGSAFVGGNFKEYTLYCDYYKDGSLITETIASSTTPVENGILGTLDTTEIPDQGIRIYLKVVGQNNIDGIRRIDVTVDNTNEPPVFIDNDNSKIAIVGKTLSFKLAKDPDDPARPAGRLEYVYDLLPPGATFDTENGMFSWRPSDAEKGTYRVTFEVRDNNYSIMRTITFYTIITEESQITNHASDGQSSYYPVIFENKIAYLGVDGHYVCGYDLETGQDIRLSPITYYYLVWPRPNVDNNRVVWDDLGSMYLYDFSTQVVRSLPLPGTSGRNPDICGDKIVFERGRDIYLYDLSSGAERQLTFSGGRYMPHIYGNIITYQTVFEYGSYPSYGDIYYYDLSRDIEISIAHDRGFRGNSKIYKDKIVWEDRGELGGETNEIWMYDIARNEKTQIADVSQLRELAIYDDNIAWCSSGNIYLHNLSLDCTIQLTSDSANYSMDMFKNKIVFGSSRANGIDKDIYMCKFYYSPEIDSVNPTNARINAPLTITGKNFGYDREDSKVVFANGAFATIVFWSNTEIHCTVPANAVSGSIAVITKGGMSNAVNITINNPPVFDPPLVNKTVNEGNELRFTVKAKDPDNPAKPLTMTAGGLPVGATFTYKTLNTYEFKWVPTSKQAGTYKIIFDAKDGTDKISQTVTITVKDVPTLPVVTSISPYNYGKPYTTIRLYGKKFGSTKGASDRVNFYNSNGKSLDAQVTAWTDSCITCRVPSLPGGTYNVTVIKTIGRSDPVSFRIIAAIS